jgi:hypothetical protein
MASDLISHAGSAVAELLRSASTDLAWVVHDTAPSWTDWPCAIVQVESVTPEASMRLLRCAFSAWLVGHEIGDASSEQAFRSDALAFLAAVGTFAPTVDGPVRSIRAEGLSDFTELETSFSSAIATRIACRLAVEVLVLSECG